MRNDKYINKVSAHIDLAKTKKFRSVILRWWRHNKRDLPWRHTNDPYPILISEFFLQRTQARQVVPIYKEFLKKYPTIQALAKEKTKKIQKSIRPLGLAKKAKFISAFANIIINEYDGKIPSNFEKLISLHGIGVYTANSILCFAFGERRPLVDRNIARLINRFFGLSFNIDRAHTDKNLWEIMSMILPRKGAREFNQALLDLEENICRPRSPQCGECLLSDICSYFNTIKD